MLFCVAAGNDWGWCGMQVFISHHSESAGDVALHVAQYLERRGIDCWVAPRDILPGEDWDDGIMRGLRSSSALVLLFSTEADDSKDVKREVVNADKLGLLLLPLRLEDIQPVRLAYWLGSPQWIDWMDRRDATLDGLVSRLQSLGMAEAPNAMKATQAGYAPESTMRDRVVAELGSQVAQPTPFLFRQLVGRTLIKVHASARAWLVELAADGTCIESHLNTDDRQHGHWGCDSKGMLWLKFGDYQLGVIGSGDGIGSGLEFNATEAEDSAPLEPFRVGVVASGRRTSRAIKWVSRPCAFRVDFAAQPDWAGAEAYSSGREVPLFGGEGGAVDLTVENDRGVGLDVVTHDSLGTQYRATLNRDSGPSEIWRGVEVGRDLEDQLWQSEVVLAWIDDGLGNRSHG